MAGRSLQGYSVGAAFALIGMVSMTNGAAVAHAAPAAGARSNDVVARVAVVQAPLPFSRQSTIVPDAAGTGTFRVNGVRGCFHKAADAVDLNNGEARHVHFSCSRAGTGTELVRATCTPPEVHFSMTDNQGRLAPKLRYTGGVCSVTVRPAAGGHGGEQTISRSALRSVNPATLGVR